MTLVSNTGPLIALAKISRLSLLRTLGWDAVFIPPRVHRELLGKVGPESAEIDAALDTFLRVVRPPAVAEGVRAAVAGLDDGEQEVIALAASMDAPVAILLDDHAARSAAKQLGLHVTGSVGILLLAKKRGFIAQVAPHLEEARRKGYWLSDGLIALAKHLAGE